MNLVHYKKLLPINFNYFIKNQNINKKVPIKIDNPTLVTAGRR